MSQDGMSIADLESNIEGALDYLRELDLRGRLPHELEPLLALVPPDGGSVHVSLRHRHGGRPMRRRDSVDTYDQRACGAWIVFESFVPEKEEDRGGFDPLADFVRALDRAESQPQLAFISLKWFRDTYLPKAGFAWTNDFDTPRRIVHEATERGILVTSKVPNPRQPEFPVTSICLNREHAEVRAILGERTETRSKPRADGALGTTEPMSGTATSFER